MIGAASSISPGYPKLTSGPTGRRSGVGHSSAPAASPAGSVPFDARRFAGVARVPPVDVPFLLGDEAHAEPEGRAGRDARRVGDELDVDVLRRDRDGGGRGGARTEQSRDQAEPGDRPEGQPPRAATIVARAAHAPISSETTGLVQPPPTGMLPRGGSPRDSLALCRVGHRDCGELRGGEAIRLNSVTQTRHAIRLCMSVIEPAQAARNVSS